MAVKAARTLRRRSARLAPRWRGPDRVRASESRTGSSQRLPELSREALRRMVAALEQASAIRGNVRQRFDGRPRDRSGDEVGRRCSDATEAVLLPTGDDGAHALVIGDGGAGRLERDAAAGAFGAAADRPRGRASAALAERRLDPRQRLEAGFAHRGAAARTRETALRQQQVEHAATVRRRRSRRSENFALEAARDQKARERQRAGDHPDREEPHHHEPIMSRSARLVNRPNGLIDDVLVPFREARAAAVAVVRLEQLRAVADVQPLAAEAIAVHGRVRVEPGDEVARLVGRIALREVRAQQREVRAVVEVGRDRDEARRGPLRLLLEADDSIVAVQLDDAVLADELAVGVVVDGDRAAVLAAPEVDVLGAG